MAFWIGFPVVLGLFSGWNQIGMVAPFLSPAWSMIYWLLLAAIMWGGLGIGTWLVSRVGSQRLPFLAMITLGAAVGVLVTRPVHAAFQSLFIPLTSTPDAIRSLPIAPASLADWALLYRGNMLLMFFWIGGALFFSRFLAYAVMQRRDVTISDRRAPTTTEVPTLPVLAGRLDHLNFDDVVTIRAEDHYLRLIAAKGEELVLYRFADAVAELTPRGWTRVHRSFAVRDSSVKACQVRGRHIELIQLNGNTVPVSERYRAIAERFVAVPR